MRLAPGTRAPDFEGTDWNGTKVRLKDYEGEKLWLAFFRYASCPLCNLRVHDIINRHERYSAAGLKTVAVFQSPPASIAEYVGKQEPPFPLVGDPDEKLYKLYGVEHSLAAFVSPANLGRGAQAMRLGFRPGRMEGTKTRIPADFLIGPDGRIEDAYYGKVIADHIPFERVESFIKG